MAVKFEMHQITEACRWQISPVSWQVGFRWLGVRCAAVSGGADWAQADKKRARPCFSKQEFPFRSRDGYPAARL